MEKKRNCACNRSENLTKESILEKSKNSAESKKTKQNLNNNLKATDEKIDKMKKLNTI